MVTNDQAFVDNGGEVWTVMVGGLRGDTHGFAIALDHRGVVQWGWKVETVVPEPSLVFDDEIYTVSAVWNNSTRFVAVGK